jgi:hypothetical protein
MNMEIIMRDKDIYSPLDLSKKCLLNLYKKCVVIEENNKLKELYENDPKTFITEICSLCLKSFRLKHGLKYKHEYQGERIGVTL